MSRLRARIGEQVVETNGSGYRLTIPVDADRFVELAGRSGTTVERLSTIERALALWDGDAFEEFSHESWAQTTAVRLNELRLVAVEDRAELLIAVRRSGEAVATLEAHVAAHPLRDRPRGLLIQALAGDGRQSDALGSYQRYRRFLAEETGTEPSAAVLEIERRVAVGEADEADQALENVRASGLLVEDASGSVDADGVATEPQRAGGGLPSGILTFLFTDIEGSATRWEHHPERMREALSLHDRIVEKTIGERDGIVFKHTGDGVGSVFASPGGAVESAIEIQRRLQTATWPEDDRLKVRIGLYMGEAWPTSGDYFGAPVSRAARVADVANGDQIAVSMSLLSFLGEVDVRPMGTHQLRGIGVEAIGLVTAEGLIADDRPLRSRVAGPKSLPTQPHRLIGRDAEVKEVVGLFDEHHAVTMVGPGGVGKTRLSIAVGNAAAPFFPDGVVFCQLDQLSHGDSVADAVAETLGARVQPGMTLTESIVNFLEGRRVLLILDNCEHVADAARSLSREVLKLNSSCVLATSREPVGLPAEQLFGVSPLDPDSDAVELFLERATERDRSFAPGDADLEHIRQICARLDGIPLGVELAAAWVRVLSPAQLVERLQDRFRVLRGGRSGGRHETLRDTVLWSYEQLDEFQARLFDRLSVFSGGFSLDAVEVVCADDDVIDSADVLDLLMVLVDKSMVISERGSGQVRFAMLGTLRQFGQEQLDGSSESELYRNRHADYFKQLAGTGSALLITDHEAEIWEMLDREWSNIRTAFETMLDADDTDGLMVLVLELGWFAALSMRFELFAWVEELADRIDLETHPDIGSFHGLRAISAYFTVDITSAGHAGRGLEIDPTDRYGYCRLALAAISLNNDFSATLSDTLTRDWLDHLTEDSPTASRMWAEGMRTFHLCTNDPSPVAAEHSARLSEIAVSTGSASAAAIAHWAGGMVTSFEGIDGALTHWQTGRESAQSLPAAHLVEDLIIGLILHFTASRGDLDQVLAEAHAALDRASKNHYLAGVSHLFGVTAIVLCRTGKAETAAALLAAMVANGHLPRPNAVRAVEKALGDRAADAQNEGADLSINDAAAMAMFALEAARTEQAEM